MFVTYPDVAYLSGCALVAGGCGPAGDLRTGGAWWVLSGFVRLLAVHAASFAQRVGSKPARPVASGVPSGWADLDRLCARG